MLLLVTAIAYGETIRFDPPNATAHHSSTPSSAASGMTAVCRRSKHHVAGSTILLR